MCQVIQIHGKSSFEEKAIKLTIKFSKDLEKDFPKNINYIITSENGWYGIIYDDWPLIKVTKFNLKVVPRKKPQWHLKFSVVEKHHITGQLNITNCFEEIFQLNNCTPKCYPVLYNFLNYQPCQTIQEFRCNLPKGKARFRCLRPKFLVHFIGKCNSLREK